MFTKMAVRVNSNPQPWDEAQDSQEIAGIPTMPFW